MPFARNFYFQVFKKKKKKNDNRSQCENNLYSFLNTEPRVVEHHCAKDLLIQ